MFLNNHILQEGDEVALFVPSNLHHFIGHYHLAKDDYYKNSAGYLDNDIVETLEFSNYGESKTLVVGSESILS